MNFINLPSFLKSKSGRQNNVTIIGTLEDEIQPHKIFDGMYCPPDARFVLMDIVGVRIDDIDMSFFASGKVVTLVNETTLRFSKKKKSGRAALSITGVMNLGRGSRDLVYSVGIKKINNKWGLYPLRASYLDKDKYPEFYDIISKGFGNGWVYSFDAPKPNGYIECCESETFTIIPYSLDGSVISTPKINSGGGSVADPFQKSTGVSENNVDVKASPVFNPISVSSDLGLGGNGEDNSELLSNQKIASMSKSLNKKIRDNRLEFVKKSPLAKDINKMIKQSETKVMDLIREIDKYEGSNDDDEDDDNVRDSEIVVNALEYTVNQLKKFWDRRSPRGASTGRAILKDALEKVLPEFKVKGAGGTSIIEDNLTVARDTVLDVMINGYDGDEENKFLESVAMANLEIYVKIIETALSIRGRLTDCFKAQEVSDEAFMTILQTNPYHLCLIDSRFKIEDLDKLAMAYGVDLKDKEVQKFRNVAYLHNYMLDNTNMNIRDNTCIKYATLRNSLKVGYVLPKTNYDYLTQTGYIIPTERIDDLRVYINKDVEDSNFALPQSGWRKAGLGYILATGIDSIGAINNYIDSGLGVWTKINGIEWVSDYMFIKKELAIYDKVYRMGKYNSSEIDDEDVKKCIEEFEELQNKKLGITDFKLEKRQADSLYLIKHGVMAVTGPAGSGKTTTAEAILYAIEKLLKVDPDEIMFCAPTGKAANRLREVVKRPTRTIHSLFGVGGASFSIKDAPDRRKKKKKISVLIVDESSMINIDLMYDMVNKLDMDTRIIFLGDIEQLPPIGFGKPFANLLTFLPCAVLNVSKRASDKSGITRNAKSLIYESDNGNCGDLLNTPDFKLIQETDADRVVNQVKDLCRHHLGQGRAVGINLVENIDKLDPDDIQVISPVNKNAWGTKNLNIVLHDIFNPRDGMSDVVVHKRGKDDEIEFRVGDRVIHTANNTKRTRFIPDGKYGKFKTIESKGIMNGDVGKVVGVFQSTQLDIVYGAEGEDDEDKEERGEGKLFVAEHIWYLAVKYHDVDTESGTELDYVIMYQFEMYQRMGFIIQSISSELNYIDLAYALTVHKLQGSQAKLVIGVLLPVRMRNFISRNMIYTLITRAKSACYLVGDVLGRESVIAEGRKVEQTGERVTTLDNIVQ